MVDVPVPIGVRSDGGLFVRVGAQVVEPGNPGLHEGFPPQGQGARSALLGEHDLPVVVAQAGQIAIVGEVEELLARALGFLAGQVR